MIGPSAPVLLDVHEPYQGFTTHLGVRRVFLRGQLVAADGALVDTRARPGRALMGT